MRLRLQYADVISDGDPADVEIILQPHNDDRELIADLYFQLGASDYVPSKAMQSARTEQLNVIWRMMYYENDRIPLDIPFNVMIKEFLLASAHGRANRKGNNPAAITESFTIWAMNQDAQIRMIKRRDRMYPKKAPKQIAAPKDKPKPKAVDITQTSLTKILRDYDNLLWGRGVNAIDMLIEKIIDELDRRILQLIEDKENISSLPLGHPGRAQ